MEITRDTLRQYGKVAAIGVVGAGLGAGAVSQADNGPTQDEYQNLQDKVDDLQEENEDLEDRPSQELVDSLQSQLDARDETISNMFTQEQVNEMVADATEREGLVDFLPVIADEDVELVGVGNSVDTEASNSNLGVGDDYEGEDYDYLAAQYNHDDGHDYRAEVYEFEDSEDADEYEEEKRDELEDSRDDVANEDYRVVREGDTVVVLTGEENSAETGYDFDAVASQY